MARYRMKHPGWVVAALVATVPVVVATLPPVVAEEVRGVLMLVFSSVCHQISSRSPHVDGVQLAVCHRCYGIYASLAVAAVVYPWLRRWEVPLHRHARIVVPAAVAVPGIDWLGDVAAIWSNTATSRMLTGAVFGLAAGFYFARAVAGLFERTPRSGQRAAP